MDPLPSTTPPVEPDPLTHHAFVLGFNALAAYIHATNRAKGWWDDELVLPDVVERYLRAGGADEALIQQVRSKVRRNDGEALMLVVTEVAEVLEGLRDRNPLSEKIGAQGFSQAEEEMADVVIRCMDLSHARGWRLPEAIIAKLAYNRTRPFKHGGRAF